MTHITAPIVTTSEDVDQTQSVAHLASKACITSTSHIPGHGMTLLGVARHVAHICGRLPAKQRPFPFRVVSGASRYSVPFSAADDNHHC